MGNQEKLATMEGFNQEKVIEEFEAITNDAKNVQISVLKNILEENAGVEYLQNHGLNGRSDPESFTACVPIATHNDFDPYIQRIINGDFSPIITQKPITKFSMSSGTTQGRSKFLPFNEKLLETTIQVFKTSFAFRNREFPIEDAKALQFIYGSNQKKTATGVTIGTASSHAFTTPEFLNYLRDTKSNCCSPVEVIYGSDFQQSLYCHLLCGLIFRNEIQFVFACFAHSLVHAFRFFEQNWEEFCTDIEHGVLSSRITDPSIRNAVSKLLTPNPELAESIRTKCIGLGNFQGLIPILFPNCKYVAGIMTGSMEPYVEKLSYYAGNLPLWSADYGASEGYIGLNANPNSPPESVSFVVVPDIAYFEFIPLDIHGSTIPDRNPVGLTDVQIGEKYDLVITSFAGLYRYKMGDVVQVVGFHNKAPKIKFICRSNLLLNIHIDKNTEKDLQLAVETASKILAKENFEVIDFTSHADISTEPGHYVIFWEINGEASDEILKECCNAMDRSFVDGGYLSSRKVDTIGPLELRIVERGTFQKVLEHFVKMGAAINQYKSPRCVGHANKKLLEVLCENVVKSYFSTAY